MKSHYNISEASDQQLLSELAQDSDQALERLYKQYYPTALQIVINNNGSADDAKDLFQEAVIILYEKVKTEDFILSCKLNTFLYAVCKRLWLKKLNQQNRQIQLDPEYEEIFPVEDEIEQHEQKEKDLNVLEGALKQIGEPCKTILEAYYLKKKNMQEISSLMGYTNADNAKNQKYKCLVRLKKIFFDQFDHKR